METAALLQNAMDIGEALLRNGAEIYRVEDSIMRVLNAYGAARIDVFAIPSLMVATLQMPNEDSVSETRRILRTYTNLDAVSRLNALCREVCRTTPPPEEMARRLRQILAVKPYPPVMTLLSYIVSSFAFAVFFGGSFMDGAASAAGGLLLYFAVHLLQRLRISPVFVDIIGAAVAAGCALLLTRFYAGAQVDKIVIGNIMMLIPGLELTNGMRDLFSGDMLAGLLHIGEAVFFASMIALGAAYILSLGGA